MNTSVIDLKNATTMSADPHRPASKELGKNEFLKLLMTQLAQQDPLDPTDSAQFVAQLSQFTQVESLTNLGTKLDDLVKLTGSNNAASVVGLLGKEVRISGNAIGGNTDVYYELPEAAQTAVLTVRDSEGTIVKTLDGLDKSQGLHRVNLKDLKAGNYTFIVEAQNASGEELKASLSHIEKVTGVSFAGPVPTLLMESGKKMEATEVVEIRQPISAEASHG